ncbi:MAG: type III-B CRISPR-associated protein Cas10/Cmr2 [Anaerolineae bacterium]|nr:type III-B CRISPR-associated protein Cas10/Cmr2 [Anaerolineae bacterium]
MPDAILIFTFSPIQSFITEARRTSDLFVASRILVKLARAAGEVIRGEHGTLIYPADLTGDAPNVIVARVPWEQAERIARDAKKALHNQWGEIASSAIERIAAKGPQLDDIWRAIWNRQTGEDYLWETYWAAALIEDGGYAGAYKKARNALDATKRTRVFVPAEEPGIKDSLSGRREALHTAELPAKDTEKRKGYWSVLSKKWGAAKLRPEGRERLDAIGAVKRFSGLAESKFPSTSTVASAGFLKEAWPYLKDYRAAIEKLLREHIYRVRDDPDWPYDGDLLFRETLEPDRLKDSYGLEKPDENLRKDAQRALEQVYRETKTHPSPYYAIIVLDGDGMGERISKCQTEEEHRDLSGKLAKFTQAAKGIVSERPAEGKHQGHLIYAGGDDVLALAPLATALPLAQALAETFKSTSIGSKDDKATASAGVAIAHHLYPLGAALDAAREAEKAAKRVPDKAAVCVQVLKRSGERAEMRSKWADLGENWKRVTEHLQNDELSSRFAYDVLSEARIVTALEDKNAHRAMLTRLVKRHKTDKLKEIGSLVEALQIWAEKLDESVPKEEGDGKEIPQGLLELGRWLIFARFVAQGGGE